VKISDFRFPIADLKPLRGIAQIGNRQWAIGNPEQRGMIKSI